MAYNKSLLPKPVRLRHLLFVVGVGLVVISGCGGGSQNLPPHVVADDSSLAPKDGRRVRLDSSNADLTKEECVALIDGYRKKAGLEGQVSVHKPSKVLNGSMTPWCVENFDGRGVVFNDNMF